MKSLLLISLLAMAFACSDRPKDINTEYEYGYDSGYENDYYSSTDSLIDSLYESIGVSGIPEEVSDAENTAEYEMRENDSPDTSAGSLSNDSGSFTITDTVETESDTLSIPPVDTTAIRSVPRDVIPDGNHNSGSYYSPDRESGKTFFNAGFNLITIIILVLLIFIIIQLFVLRNRISNTYENTKILKTIAKSQRITRNIDMIENRLNKIETNIGQILKEQSKAVSKSSSGSKGERYPRANENKLPRQDSIKGKKINSPVEFFMPSPDNDGNFDNRKKSDHFIPSESIYKFIMNNNSDNSASFFIHKDQNNMERAINYYSSILEKVCKSDNAFNPMGKSIETIKPGRAVLIDNKWVVKEKALVRYD